MGKQNNNPGLSAFKVFCDVQYAKDKELSEPKKDKRGAPSKYKPEYAQQAFNQCLLGSTDAELATFFEVNVDTIHEWKKKHKEFSDALKSGKTEADDKVAASLYSRATGYTHDSEEIKVVSNGGFDGSSVVRVPIKKHYAPDVLAQIFWLKNRQPDKWREKQEIDHSGNLAGLLEVKIVRAAKPDDEEPAK